MLRACLTLILLTVPAFGDDLAELKSSFEAAVESLNRGDVEGFLKDVHPEAMSFYSCGPTSGKQGKEACQLDWERFFGKTRDAKFELRNVQYKVFGDSGIVWGEYEVDVDYNGKRVRHEGRYTFTYAKIGRRWLVVMQHNTPASENPVPVRKGAPSRGS